MHCVRHRQGFFVLFAALDFFSTQNIAITILDYPMSYTELIATVLGVAATILSAMRITYTWLVNVVAVVFYAAAMYQLRLYSDLILQVYYFSIGILGWLWWSKKAKHHVVPVSYWAPKPMGYILALAGLGVATAVMGYITSHFHVWMPQWFPHPAAMPYPNAAILVVSITGTFLMSRRKIENWWLWAVSNPVAAWIYWQQDSLLFAIVFLVYWVIGLSGWYAWQKEYLREKQNSTI